MPDIDQIIILIEKAFNSEVSLIIIQILVFGLLAWVLLRFLDTIMSLWRNYIQPLFFFSNNEEKHRNKLRRLFASHIASEIDQLNLKESWRDHRFAELEAEVEAEASWKKSGWQALFKRSQEGVRREPSLSKALESSTDKYILVEGDPGSGKSVALRYVAKQLASRAAKSHSNKSIIPLYINLKELERHQDEAINRSLIERFILQTLNRVNDRDIDTFLEDEFQRGLRDGSWLFLFDSFDEIPEVLSSTEKDPTVISYAAAISDFLHGMNKCRGVIASRQFKGPKLNEFREFTILALSEERKRSLIKKAMLKKEAENELLGGLGLASQEISDMSKNPMFLSLLCEHIGSGHPFPENGHAVFETYINSRLNKDRDRLFKRFRITPEEVRHGAEIAAFAMLAEKNIGLSPTREQLIKAINHQNMTILSDFNKILDALEYIKLARSVEKANTTDPKNFTFAHRRFQEYFATNTVLREPHRIGQKQLLTDARWRETAVVLCQTQNTETISPLLREARNILQGIAIETSNVFEHSQDFPKVIGFHWLPYTLHIISLLQGGFGNRLRDVSPEICALTEIILCPAYNHGTRMDKKWAIEVAGVIPQDGLLRLLRESLNQRSKLLQDAAYSQVSRLKKIPPDIANGILKSITNMSHSGRLAREKLTTRTYLQRLENPQRFISSMELLLYAPRIDFVLRIALLILVFTQPLRLPDLISTLNVSSEIRSYVNFFLQITSYIFIAFCFLLPIRLDDITNNIKTLERVVILIAFAMIRLMVFIFVLLLFSFNSIISPLYLIAISYIATWFPLSSIVAQTGKFNTKSWWPFLHFGITLYSILNSKKVFFKCLSVFLIFAIIFGLFVRFHNFIIQFMDSALPILFLVMFVLSIPVVILSTDLGTIGPIKKTKREFDDWKRWRYWLKNTPTKITGDEIVELIHQFHNNYYPNKIIKHIRTEDLIAPTEHTERALLVLALTVENRITLNNYDIPWFLGDNTDFIDEVTLLRESIYNRRILFESSIEAQKLELSPQPISAS